MLYRIDFLGMRKNHTALEILFLLILPVSRGSKATKLRLQLRGREKYTSSFIIHSVANNRAQADITFYLSAREKTAPNTLPLEPEAEQSEFH